MAFCEKPSKLFDLFKSSNFFVQSTMFQGFEQIFSKKLQKLWHLTQDDSLPLLTAVNKCARLEERRMELFKKTGVEITKTITNLVSKRNSSDVFGFFLSCSSFYAFKENFKCTTQRFISHHVLVRYSASISTYLY